jgi:hypothetical protein
MNDLRPIGNRTVIASHWKTKPSNAFALRSIPQIELAGKSQMEYIQVERVKQFFNDSYSRVENIILVFRYSLAGVNDAIYTTHFDASSGVIHCLDVTEPMVAQFQSLTMSALASHPELLFNFLNE